VIALLLAISLPVLTKIRCLSKRVACQSNLRQIAVAWQAYFADNSDSFYQGINANVIFGGWKGIAFDPPVPRPLNKYFSLPQIVNSEMDAKIFRCPADNGGLNVTPLPIYHYLGNSYQTNILLIGQNQIGWLPSAELKKQINKRLENIAYSHVDSPGRVLLVGDYGWVNQSFPAVPKIKDWHSKPAHHNVAFLDGHVEFLNIRKGLYITEAYTVLPWKDLYSLASEVQEEE
jgi:prepilin-type processing-associated H-X9-DG protein